MKKTLLLLSLVLMAYASYGQTMIEGFNMARPDSGSFATSIEGNKSRLTMSQNTADKKEGAASLQVNALIGAYHEWGSYNQVGFLNKDSLTQDWSASDTLSIWIKVTQAPKTPENMVFRIQVSDKPSKAEPQEQYIYENAVVLDSLHEWYLLKIPFTELTQVGTTVPNDQGFILAPTSWGGFTYNNRKLDRDKIYDWTLGIITSGYTAGVNLPADSIIVLYDGFQRSGNRATPVIVFNGVDYASAVSSPYSWGQSALSVVKGAGTTAKGSAMVWTLGDEWANGWTGIGLNLNTQNMTGAWAADSVQFKIKSSTTMDTMRVQFEAGTGKRAKMFKIINDNAWHTYKFALKDLTFIDGAAAVDFNPGAMTAVGFMSNGNKYGVGDKIYITDFWTGNPVFDVIAPEAPTALKATALSYSNLLTWTDTPNENGAKYNVYFSEKTFTDGENDATVEKLAPYNFPAGTQAADHLLRAPVTDQNISLYYAITATDASGNVSNQTPVFGPITNKAKGVPTISKVAPANLKIDGALSAGEWTAIAPIVMNSFRSPATAHLAGTGQATDSLDLSVKAYVAMDSKNLYVAFDVADDTVSVDTLAGNDYEQDCPDLFIGLYDWRGKNHAGYTRGAKPEYHFRFSQNRIKDDGLAKIFMYPGVNYVWKTKTLKNGYIVEAVIPFQLLKDTFPQDTLFTPKEGMRIPIDFAVNDRDSKTTRDGILCYSTIADDNSYQDMFRWTYTWIGTQWVTAVANNAFVPGTYALEQNFPNPFNPSTKINYSLGVSGNVTLKIFDVLGREVMTVVNENQVAGHHTAIVNAARLSSGMYIYKLESGSFSSVKKMMFLK